MKIYSYGVKIHEFSAHTRTSTASLLMRCDRIESWCFINANLSKCGDRFHTQVRRRRLPVTAQLPRPHVKSFSNKKKEEVHLVRPSCGWQAGGVWAPDSSTGRRSQSLCCSKVGGRCYSDSQSPCCSACCCPSSWSLSCCGSLCEPQEKKKILHLYWRSRGVQFA